MPYKVKKQGDKYVVYKKDTGDRVGATAGNKEALRKYLAALHLNANEGAIKLLNLISEAENPTEKAFEEFAETRGKGAAKIAATAEEKGGLALLTWHHFKVKAQYYKKATEGKFDAEAAKKEFEETYKKISLSMTPIEFQREVGRLEVLGELLIKNK